MRSLLLPLALLLSLPAAAQSPAFAIDTATVALYTFDGTHPDTTFDISGNGNHALNDGTTSMPGRHGNAREFDGVDDKIDMDAVRVALQGSSAWTLEYIARSVDSTWIPILLAHNCRNGWRLDYSGFQSRIGYKSSTSPGFCNWAVDQFVSVGAFGPTWHYYALVFGDGELNFYVDGNLQHSEPASGLFQGDAGSRAWIGHSDFGAGAYFPGLADELRVSNVVRSADELCLTAAALGWGCPPVATEPDGALPGAYALHAVYPNPFHPAATVRYDVPEAGRVRLAVYDALGREVAVLVDGERAAGTHTAVLDGQGLASGLYLVRLTAASFEQARTVTLLR